MKGLLLKEFQVWLRTRSYFLIYLLAMTVVACFMSSRISVIGLGVLIGQISNTFLTDEKCGWQNYSKTLPCTPFQRVTAKYLITSFELFFGIAAYIISTFVVSNNLTHSTGVTSLFPPPTPMEIYSDTCIIIAISALYLAIDLPICFKLTGSKRTAMSLIPSVIYIFTVIMGLNIFSNGEWNILINNLKWIPAVIAVISFILFGASWMISVIIETNSDTDYKKKFKKIAIILVVITVAIASVTAMSIYKASQDRTVDNSGKYDSMNDVETVTEEINKYYESFCGELHIGTKIYDYVLGLKEAGFVQDDERTDIYYSASGSITVDIGVSYPSEEKIGKLHVTCKHATKTFESATYESFKNIELCFKKGMTEAELHEKFKELEIIPCDIEETFNDIGRRRYSFEFITPDFENEEGGVWYTLHIDTDGEKVTDVDGLMMHSRDNTPVATDPVETPDEIAAREIKEYANNFCGESNITKTTREFIKELKVAGYTESQNTFDYYYSPDEKVSVSIGTDENDDLKNITVIVHFGKMRTVDSIKKLDEFAAEISVGMEEKALIEKLDELDALPDIITEDYTSNNEQRRTYNIKYNVEDPDGNVSCSVTIESINGKVTDVLVF